MKMAVAAAGSSSTSASTSRLPPLQGTAPASPPVKSGHLDYVHDLAFDTYGRRLVTCGGDRLVKVWDLQLQQESSASHAASANNNLVGGGGGGGGGRDNSEWVCTSTWQAHRGSVTGVCWCHPEFGTLIATAGSDQEVKVWEERHGGLGAAAAAAAAALGAVAAGGAGGGLVDSSSSPSSSSSLWTLRASLGDARRAVTSVAFSPRHHGLKLAAGSADGCIRIYEAIDVISVGSWPLQACLQLYGGAAAADDAAAATSPSPASSSSAASHWLTLSWCNGRFDPPTLVVGGGGAPPTAGVVASVVAATASTVALAAAAGGAGGGGGPEASSPDIPPHPPSSSPAPGLQSLVVVRYVESARSWLPIRVLNSGTPVGAAPRISRPATCVAWAPNVGRRYHYVAAAHGTSLIIYRLARGGSRSTSSSDRSTAAGGGGLGPSNGTPAPADASAALVDLQVVSAQVLDVPAWKCQWNVTGTVLASSGDGGSVWMHRAADPFTDGQFVLVSTINPPGPPE